MLRLALEGLADGDMLPQRFAFCALDEDGLPCPGANHSPAVNWHDVPPAARSLALLCVDLDAPSRRDNVNRPGRLVPASLPRMPFYHWTLIDVPPDLGGLPMGACAAGVVPGGKPDTGGPGGSRQGLNDYTGWFGEDHEMRGSYYGYDGPCPPRNDTLIHRYAFRLYALDTARLTVAGALTGPAALAAMAGHVVGEAQVMTTYTLNPDLRQRPVAT